MAQHADHLEHLAHRNRLRSEAAQRRADAETRSVRRREQGFDLFLSGQHTTAAPCTDRVRCDQTHQQPSASV